MKTKKLIDLEESLLEEVKEIANEEGRSTNGQIIYWIKKAVKSGKNGS